MKLNTLKFKLFMIVSLLFLTTGNAQKTLDIFEKNVNKENQIEIKQHLKKDNKSLEILMMFGEKPLQLILSKNKIFGQNTKCLIDDGTGKLVETPMKEEQSYSGKFKEYPNYHVNAIVFDQQVLATIFKQDGTSYQITPSITESNKYNITKDVINSITTNKCTAGKLIDISSSIEWNSSDSKRAISELDKTNSNHKNIINSSTSSKPNKVMEVLEFEIGVEIGSKAFFANSAYNGDLTKAQMAAQSIIGNLNARFLSAAGVRFRLGTLVVRTNSNTDPLRNKVVSTGGDSNANSSLRAFRDYWKNNPDEVGNTHDLAVYHVKYPPSGLAYVGGVGTTNNKYSTLGGNGATSWANGTAAHEVGHLFGLYHVNQSQRFYEAKPRNDQGSNNSGGNQDFFSIMDGRGRHNIGRMPVTEANTVLALRDKRKESGDLIKNPQKTKPYGVFDEANVTISKPRIVIDVIANDYDINNDVLDVRLLDTKSFLGGTISLSSDTGPGGRNQIIYSAPSSGISTRDFFHYTVFDTSGKSDFGVVYIDQVEEIDIDDKEIAFDFGTQSSPLFSNAIRVSHKTKTPDYGWQNTNDLGSRDRGAATGVNDYNRDFIQSTKNKKFEVNVDRGVWNVLITFGDRDFTHDKMAVKAQGELRLKDVKTNPKQFLNRSFNVDVKDGKITLEFMDQGGSDKNWAITRLALKKVKDFPPLTAETTFDFGTPSSPIFNNAIRIDHTTNFNDYGWVNTNELDSRDRGIDDNINALNRDFIFSKKSKVFEARVKPGVWEVLITFGDRLFDRDRMAVKAEGKLKISNFSTQATQFRNGSFQTEVKDGKLSLEFSDLGGENPHWTITRVKIKRVSELLSKPPIGAVIGLIGNNGKYVSSENGKASMNCNRSRLGNLEQFTVIDAGNGKIALKDKNGNYVSSENGRKPMISNRQRLGSWEKFTWKLNNGKVTLKGNNNLYVSSENGTKSMNCNRNRIGSFERFDIYIVKGSTKEEQSETTKHGKPFIYPNPTNNGIISVNGVKKDDLISIIDYTGKIIKREIINDFFSEYTLNLSTYNNGVYFIKINNDNTIKVILSKK